MLCLERDAWSMVKRLRQHTVDVKISSRLLVAPAAAAVGAWPDPG